MIVKAEILWTRKCPLSCSFCAMKKADIERAPTTLMIEGLYNLKELGVNFIAIYGASPIYDMGELDLFIAAATSLGILSTVITDGVSLGHKEKLELLYEAGLRSLTTSCDFVPYDLSSKRKTVEGLGLVRWFSEFSGVRDVEIVATVTSENYKTIIKSLPNLKGIWFSFDFIHPDRGNPGTKCRGQNHDLIMGEYEINEFCKTLLKLKERGVKIHQSKSLLQELVRKPSLASTFSWNCANREFPSWLTIDADGTVLPCDDFYTDRSYKVWDFSKEKLKEFSSFYFDEVKKKCFGCFWTTHYDAWLIKRGEGSFDDYVHK